VQFCAPDDGRKNRLKHVERLKEINKLRKVASRWSYSEYILAMHGPMKVKKRVISLHLLYSQSVFLRYVALLLISTSFLFLPVAILRELYRTTMWNYFVCAHSEAFAHIVSESLILHH